MDLTPDRIGDLVPDLPADISLDLLWFRASCDLQSYLILDQ
jgi:hypothetical protein